MALKASKPPEPQENPYLPAGMQLRVMEQFAGVNRSTLRMGVPDEQCYWIDGFIPLDQRNLRTLYSNGAFIFEALPGLTVVCFFCLNIGTAPIALVFMSDGSVVQVDLTNNVASFVLPAGAISILGPVITNVGVTQWGQQYAIIVAKQTNGYWLWDGTVLYTAGTLAPTVTLTNAGAAYQTVPNVIVSGGTGSGAVMLASIAGGRVVNVKVINPGSGYSVGDVVTLSFVGGTSGGSGAALTANMSLLPGGSGGALTINIISNPNGSKDFVIGSVTINSGGAGYSVYTTVTLVGGSTGGGGVPSPFGRPGSLLLNIVGGSITSVTIADAGSYLDATVPTATITDIGVYVVSSISGAPTGAGYSASTRLTVSGGAASAVQASLRPVIVGGVITSVVINNGGSYSSNSPVPTIAITDAPVNAAATASLMPYGVQGTSVETYSQRVWVVDGPHLYFTAPGSFSDFATSSGGGNQTSGDSFLRVAYTRLLNTNGFLFLIADSSVSYISGVQISDVGSPPVPTTTFTYQNADPQVGSPYPCSVQAFGRSIMLANAVGIYQGNGGDFKKVSDLLDTVYDSVPRFGDVQISSAQATIFGRKIFMELVHINDPVTGLPVNKLLMWNSRSWFASEQDVALTFIASNEINSVLTAYGTDGTKIYPLFQTPSANLLKTVQSKYWDDPGYVANKAVNRFFGMAQYYDVTSSDFTLDVDNETINSNYTITGPVVPGVFIIPPQAVAQQGVLTGMTIKTHCKDMALISVAIDNTNVSYRG